MADGKWKLNVKQLWIKPINLQNSYVLMQGNLAKTTAIRLTGDRSAKRPLAHYLKNHGISSERSKKSSNTLVAVLEYGILWQEGKRALQTPAQLARAHHAAPTAAGIENHDLQEFPPWRNECLEFFQLNGTCLEFEWLQDTASLLQRVH